MSVQDAVGYAGDVKAVDAFELLAENPSAVLVDVRTKAEWAYVGVPDLKSGEAVKIVVVRKDESLTGPRSSLTAASC